MIDVNEYILLSKTERQAHVNLDDPCLARGGHRTEYRGILAEHLNTSFPENRVAILCHACNNEKCSNPKHLYWGTYYENTVEDGKQFGHYHTPWEATVAKYGEEKARTMQGRKNNDFGKANKGVPKSKQHKQNLSESIKQSYKRGRKSLGGKSLGGRPRDEETKKIVLTARKYGIPQAAKMLGLSYVQVKSKYYYYQNKF